MEESRKSPMILLASTKFPSRNRRTCQLMTMFVKLCSMAILKAAAVQDSFSRKKVNSAVSTLTRSATPIQASSVKPPKNKLISSTHTPKSHHPKLAFTSSSKLRNRKVPSADLGSWKSTTIYDSSPSQGCTMKARRKPSKTGSNNSMSSPPSTYSPLRRRVSVSRWKVSSSMMSHYNPQKTSLRQRMPMTISSSAPGTVNGTGNLKTSQLPGMTTSLSASQSERDGHLWNVSPSYAHGGANTVNSHLSSYPAKITCSNVSMPTQWHGMRRTRPPRMKHLKWHKGKSGTRPASSSTRLSRWGVLQGLISLSLMAREFTLVDHRNYSTRPYSSKLFTITRISQRTNSNDQNGMQLQGSSIRSRSMNQTRIWIMIQGLKNSLLGIGKKTALNLGMTRIGRSRPTIKSHFQERIGCTSTWMIIDGIC